jgi:hypothetical protein
MPLPRPLWQDDCCHQPQEQLGNKVGAARCAVSGAVGSASRIAVAAAVGNGWFMLRRAATFLVGFSMAKHLLLCAWGGC